MNGAQSRTVTLQQPLPVYVYYSTALAEPDGTVRFFEDIYGLDRVLERDRDRELFGLPPKTKREE
jgi:murein L,D-transpeptidase YcbB/YkuD